jgi:hypothetical protein
MAPEPTTDKNSRGIRCCRSGDTSVECSQLLPTSLTLNGIHGTNEESQMNTTIAVKNHNPPPHFMLRFIGPFFILITGAALAQHTSSTQLPLQPAVGVKNILWIRTEFGSGSLPANSDEQIHASMKSFSDYLYRVSGGKASVGEVTITPVFKSKLPPADFHNNPNLVAEEMEKLARKAKFKLPPFIYYMFDGGPTPSGAPAIDIGAGALGSGDGKTGRAWIPSLYIPGVVHESFHMLGVGHAEDLLAEGKSIYPGKTHGGLDPYHFMGSEEDMTHSPSGEAGDLNWSLDATIPLPMKSYMGWLDKRNLYRAHGKSPIKQRIYMHDGDSYPPDRLLGIVLEGYSKTSRFMISYVKNAKSRAIKTTGVLVHELPYESPSVSRLLDLHPNSSPANTYRPGDEAYNRVFELGDAALASGETVAIPNFFTLQVLAEGGTGNDRWADVIITPTKK